LRPVDAGRRHETAGLQGIGELGIFSTAAAIANAIHHANGKRLRKLPFTLADIQARMP